MNSHEESLPELTARLAERPAPVLAVDTCALLDIVRSPILPANRQGRIVQAARHILEQPIHLVMAQLVVADWQRHLAAVQSDVSDHLNALRGSLEAVSAASVEAGGVRFDIDYPNLAPCLIGLCRSPRAS